MDRDLATQIERSLEDPPLKLRALVALVAGDTRKALAEMTVALKLAARSGHRQTFLDDPVALRGLLDKAAACAGVHLPGATDTEVLTDREMDMLHFLPSHFSYRESSRVARRDPRLVHRQGDRRPDDRGPLPYPVRSTVIHGKGR